MIALTLNSGSVMNGTTISGFKVAYIEIRFISNYH